VEVHRLSGCKFVTGSCCCWVFNLEPTCSRKHIKISCLVSGILSFSKTNLQLANGLWIGGAERPIKSCTCVSRYYDR
jgi:hypothetical protein